MTILHRMLISVSQSKSIKISLLKFKRCDFLFYHLQAHGRVEEDQREFDECIPGFVY